MKRIVVLGFLVLSLCTVNLVTPAASASLSVGDQSATGYSCPWYSRYCSKNSHCAGYCGVGTPPEWEICYQGCCTCLG
jgi:hypothetical protein